MKCRYTVNANMAKVRRIDVLFFSENSFYKIVVTCPVTFAAASIRVKFFLDTLFLAK